MPKAITVCVWFSFVKVLFIVHNLFGIDGFVFIKKVDYVLSLNAVGYCCY